MLCHSASILMANEKVPMLAAQITLLKIFLRDTYPIFHEKNNYQSFVIVGFYFHQWVLWSPINTVQATNANNDWRCSMGTSTY